MNELQNKATTIHNYICKLREEIHRNFFQLAVLLKQVRDNRYYIEKGYHSFEDYCEQPEIDLSRSRVFKLITIYEKWIETYGYKPEELNKIDTEKLYIAGSQAKDDTQEEWLERARLLTRADLRALTPGAVQRYQKVKCPHCGKIFELKQGVKVKAGA